MTQFSSPPNILVINCVSALGDDITEMKDLYYEKELDIDEFLSIYTGGDKDKSKDLADVLGYPSIDQLKNDWHVSYHASFYRGEPCLYAVHSCIEHVFMTQESASRVADFDNGEERQQVIERLADEWDEYEPLESAKTEGEAIRAAADFYREHKEEMDDYNILLASITDWNHPDIKAIAKADQSLILQARREANIEMAP